MVSLITHHDKLFAVASRATNKLGCDMTVSNHQTIESLEALRDEIDMLIAAIEEDIERELNFPG